MTADSSLTEAERNLIVRMFGNGCNILSSTVARLYVAPPKGVVWKFANIIGALAVMNDKNMKGHFLRMIDIKTMKITFEQEIYEHFEYKNPRAWFHTFESDNVVHGFSFANEREAKAFFDSVNTVVYSISGPPIVTSAPTPAPVNNAQQLTKQKSFNAPAPATTAEKKPKEKKKLFGKKKKEDAVFEISGPTGFKHESHIGWDAKKGFEIRNIPPEWKKLFQQAGIRKSEMRDAETASMMISIVSSSLASGMPNNAPPPPPGPGGAPPGPRPTSSMPQRMSQHPHPQQPPPQMSQRMSQLPPQHMSQQYQHAPLGHGPPPPPPTNRSPSSPGMGAPPPPPPPGPVGGAPPPPPPPPVGGAPPPPPPPPGPGMNKTPSFSGGDGTPQSSLATSDSRGDLLAAIRGGAQLRKVDPASLPDISSLPETDSKSIVDTLANAIKARRLNIHVEDEEEAADDWSDDEEWSD